MTDILKVIDVLKKLLTNPTQRYVIGEATTHTTPRATVIYDDKVGSPAENLTFIIPDDGTPAPQPKAVIKPDTLVAYPGQTTALDGSQSTGLVPLQYQWSKLSGDFDILNPTASVTSIKVSDTAQPGASFGVSLQVTDANGTSDSTQKSISIIGPPPPPSQIKAKVVAVNASKQDSGKEANKVLDGDYETRWSAEGIGEWIEFTFDQPYKIKTVKLTGYHYDKSYDFEINGKSFTCPANRTPNTLIDFDLSSLNIDSDKVRIIGKGNSSSDYNSYREIELWGEPGSPPPTVAVIKPDNPSGQPGTIIALDGSQSTGKQPLKYFWTADINTTAIKVLNPESVSTNVQISSTATPGTSAKINLSVTDADGMPAATSKHVSIVGDIPPPPPPPPPTGLTRLLAFADNDTTNDAEDVLTAMMKVPNVAEYEFVGDGPYSKSGTKWVSMMKKYFDSEKVKKLRISQGNHEHKESESQQTEEDIEDWIPSLNKSPEALDWTSSGQVGNVYVISGNTQDMDVEFKREQFNWLKSELEKAKSLRVSGAIEWIVYMCHKPFFTLKSSHSPYTAVRFNYKDIFRDAQVDFVLHGHNHNTQLWLPMIPNDSDANGEGTQLFTRLPDGTFDFSKDHGAAYIITGHAGHEWNGINDSGSGVKNVMHYRDSGKFGFTQLDFEGRKATIKSIDSDGKVHFEYKVSREGGSPPPPPPPGGCPTGQCIDPITRQCRFPQSNETIDPTTGECKLIPIPPPPGEIDEHGLAWEEAKGPKTIVKMSRDRADDDRWSFNVKNCENGFEQIFIGKSKGTNSSSHFASKLWGGNHSGSGASSQRWYDLGIRNNGDIQLQWEGPHPSNHDFTIPANKQFIKNIGKGLDNNWIGLRWLIKPVKPGGSPADGGVRCRMWVDTDPLDANGKPRNNWQLAFDFIDGVDAKVINPQSYKLQGEMDAEVRRSDTANHDTYGDGKIYENAQIGTPGLHVRPLT